MIFEVDDILVQNASEAEIKVEAIATAVSALGLAVFALLEAYQFFVLEVLMGILLTMPQPSHIQSPLLDCTRGSSW